MWKYLLFVIGIWHLGTAIYMWFAPQLWYVQTPGVAMMGLFNLHFIRDIALVFALSGAAMVLGVIRGNPTAVWFGAGWPALHAVFHIWIWTARGVPLDQVALVNLIGIQLPALLALTAALSHFRKGETS